MALVLKCTLLQQIDHMDLESDAAKINKMSEELQDDIYFIVHTGLYTSNASANNLTFRSSEDLLFDFSLTVKFAIHHHQVMIVYDDIYQDSIYTIINDLDDPSINTSPKLRYYPSLLTSSETSIDPSPNPNVNSTFLMYPSSHNIECRTDPGKRLKDPMQKNVALLNKKFVRFAFI